MSLKIKFGKQNEQIQYNSDLNNVKEQICLVFNIKNESLKLMFKGKMIKTQEQYQEIPIESLLSVLGTLNDQKKIEIDEERVENFEDQQQEYLPLGIQNYGNTCYINTAVNLLFRCTQVKEDIQKQQNQFSQSLINIHPNTQKFLEQFFQEFKLFKFQQQEDLDECFNIMIQKLQISKFFEYTVLLNGKQEQTTKQIVYIQDNSVLESITKQMVDNHGKFQSLPEYLSVQICRFQNKIVNDKSINCKIFKPILIQEELDLRNLIDTEFVQLTEQQKEEDQNELFNQWQQGKEGEIKKLWSQFKEEQKIQYIENKNKELYQSEGKPTGLYKLIGIGTHQGEEISRGHYISWIHEKGDDWLKFDDAIVSQTSLKEIIDQQSSASAHLAYYLIYKKIYRQ